MRTLLGASECDAACARRSCRREEREKALHAEADAKGDDKGVDNDKDEDEDVEVEDDDEDVDVGDEVDADEKRWSTRNRAQPTLSSASSHQKQCLSLSLPPHELKEAGDNPGTTEKGSDLCSRTSAARQSALSPKPAAA